MLRIFAVFILIAAGFISMNVLHTTNVYEINTSDPDAKEVKLKAGKTIKLKIHDSYTNQDSICELRVPENYSKLEPTPIFVWFSPGKGSSSISSVPHFVNFEDYFILALPYLDNQLPRLAIKDGTIDEFWDYDYTMLAYVINIIPNLSSNTRIAGGFSSGAHFVASGLDRDWAGFTDFFTGYIIHEGGYAPEMVYSGIKPSDKILVTYGASINSYGKLVAQMMSQEHKENLTVYAVPDTGHEITTQTTEYIKNWLDENFNVDEVY